MELREYLAIRKAYNLVRQSVQAQQRLTFVEFAILSHLTLSDRPATTSEIAEYQRSLRPTMTHRTKNLTELGLLRREKGASDRRNVICMVTDEGVEYVYDLCTMVCNVLKGGKVLPRTSPERIVYYVDAMGSFNCMSGDLILLCLSNSPEDSHTVSSLVDSLGLLQPTVSMTVAALEDKGLVTRFGVDESTRSASIKLTDEGAARAELVKKDIVEIVVRRRR